ncbi:hypothetical protein [Capnocytophaga sp.]|uniref:hypothetical protein n=1 Tax=Capnocytophaga sp. TaxID=44737 RepID=UPI0026DD9D3C|nr:hypothetical protein [Capnocytophaga sp.]MDO5104475.1 hypothetical protein [Capnocytophaga sp.]
MEQTPHEKTLFIINELELSARQVAVAIGKTGSAIVKKQKRVNYNCFLEDDFQKLKSFYVKKLEKIKNL